MLSVYFHYASTNLAPALRVLMLMPENVLSVNIR